MVGLIDISIHSMHLGFDNDDLTHVHALVVAFSRSISNVISAGYVTTNVAQSFADFFSIHCCLD